MKFCLTLRFSNFLSLLNTKSFTKSDFLFRQFCPFELYNTIMYILVIKREVMQCFRVVQLKAASKNLVFTNLLG